MATKTSSPGVSLTCPVCDITVSQAPGTRRTICPHCGNFYDSEGARAQGGPTPRLTPTPRLLVQRPRSYPSVEDQDVSEATDGRDGQPRNGPLRAVSNFFQNKFGNNDNGKERSKQKRESSAKRNKSARKSGTDTILPPISTSQNGLLSVDCSRSGNSSRASSRNTNTKSPSGYHNVGPNHKVQYPIRNKSIEQLYSDVISAQASNNWSVVQEFYSTTFDSFVEINAAFKRDPNKEYKSTDDSGIRTEFVNAVFDHLLDLPQDIQKVVLKAIINSLLKDKRLTDTSRPWPHTKDDLRCYLILIQNPQFHNITTFVIFAHLLRQMSSLTDSDHHYLVHWFKKMESRRFKALIQKLHHFVSCRLFPPKPEDLPPISKCTWWIPSATKVLALLNAANNLSQPNIITFLDFYNPALDHLDLMTEYYTWQNPSAHPGFSFCQYPFILSISAKRTILQRDSEQQMIIMARRSLVAKVQRRQLPDIGMLFLNLNVRRTYLVSDSLNEIARKQHDLKKKLKVTFVGEAGLDMGGLTKEWFLLLIRQIFNEQYGMFTYDKKAQVFWFSSTSCENYQEFNLVGVLMGLAVYNTINLDIRFPAICYKKLLSPAVVPYANPNATVGVCGVTVDELAKTKPELASGLKELLSYEGDVEEDFGLTFMVSYNEFGSVKSHTLKPNGENIPVTNQNRTEYVQLYVDYLLNKSMYNQFQAFYHGFHSVCASNALIMLRPEEVEMLVCGSPTIDMSALKKVTAYDGYKSHDLTIKYFWDVVLHLSRDLQKRLLLFTTGSDRIPIGGMREFKITRVENLSMLPMAHTCFNQLILPAYTSKKLLKQKLIIAVQNAEGFGIE